MRIYLDTSFIVPRFIKEATSAAVVTKLQAVSTEELTISLWTKAEFSSVLARRVQGLPQPGVPSAALLQSFAWYS